MILVWSLKCTCCPDELMVPLSMSMTASVGRPPDDGVENGQGRAHELVEQDAVVRGKQLLVERRDQVRPHVAEVQRELPLRLEEHRVDDAAERVVQQLVDAVLGVEEVQNEGQAEVGHGQEADQHLAVLRAEAHLHRLAQVRRRRRGSARLLLQVRREPLGVLKVRESGQRRSVDHVVLGLALVDIERRIRWRVIPGLRVRRIEGHAAGHAVLSGVDPPDELPRHDALLVASVVALEAHHLLRLEEPLPVEDDVAVAAKLRVHLEEAALLWIRVAKELLGIPLLQRDFVRDVAQVALQTPRHLHRLLPIKDLLETLLGRRLKVVDHRGARDLRIGIVDLQGLGLEGEPLDLDAEAPRADPCALAGESDEVAAGRAGVVVGAVADDGHRRELDGRHGGDHVFHQATENEEDLELLVVAVRGFRAIPEAWAFVHVHAHPLAGLQIQLFVLDALLPRQVLRIGLCIFLVVFVGVSGTPRLRLRIGPGTAGFRRGLGLRLRGLLPVGRFRVRGALLGLGTLLLKRCLEPRHPAVDLPLPAIVRVLCRGDVSAFLGGSRLRHGEDRCEERLDEGKLQELAVLDAVVLVLQKGAQVVRHPERLEGVRPDLDLLRDLEEIDRHVRRQLVRIPEVGPIQRQLVEQAIAELRDVEVHREIQDGLRIFAVSDVLLQHAVDGLCELIAAPEQEEPDLFRAFEVLDSGAALRQVRLGGGHGRVRQALHHEPTNADAALVGAHAVKILAQALADLVLHRQLDVQRLCVRGLEVAPRHEVQQLAEQVDVRGPRHLRKAKEAELQSALLLCLRGRLGEHVLVVCILGVAKRFLQGLVRQERKQDLVEDERVVDVGQDLRQLHQVSHRLSVSRLVVLHAHAVARDPERHVGEVLLEHVLQDQRRAKAWHATVLGLGDLGFVVAQASAVGADVEDRQVVLLLGVLRDVEQHPERLQAEGYEHALGGCLHLLDPRRDVRQVGLVDLGVPAPLDQVVVRLVDVLGPPEQREDLRDAVSRVARQRAQERLRVVHELAHEEGVDLVAPDQGAAIAAPRLEYRAGTQVGIREGHGGHVRHPERPRSPQDLAEGQRVPDGVDLLLHLLVEVVQHAVVHQRLLDVLRAGVGDGLHAHGPNREAVAHALLVAGAEEVDRVAGDAEPRRRDVLVEYVGHEDAVDPRPHPASSGLVLRLRLRLRLRIREAVAALRSHGHRDRDRHAVPPAGTQADPRRVSEAADGLVRPSQQEADAARARQEALSVGLDVLLHRLVLALLLLEDGVAEVRLIHRHRLLLGQVVDLDVHGDGVLVDRVGRLDRHVTSVPDRRLRPKAADVKPQAHSGRDIERGGAIAELREHLLRGRRLGILVLHVFLGVRLAILLGLRVVEGRRPGRVHRLAAEATAHAAATTSTTTAAAATEAGVSARAEALRLGRFLVRLDHEAAIAVLAAQQLLVLLLIDQLGRSGQGSLPEVEEHLRRNVFLWKQRR
eukprot:scaffold110_cov247-Pinguiococcus_pyrenoidosus.AAC.3